MEFDELIETLREFEEKRVEQLPENAQKLFYAIMKIADERDEMLEKIYRANNIYLKELDKCNKNGTYVSKVAVDMYNELEGNINERK